VTIPEEDVDEGEDEGGEDKDEDKEEDEDENEDEDEDEDKEEDEDEDKEEDEDEDKEEGGEEDKGNDDQSNKGDESGEGKQDEQNEGKEEEVGQSEENAEGNNHKGKGNESIRKQLNSPLNVVDNEDGQRGRPMTPKAVAGDRPMTPKAVAGDIQMQSPQNSPPALHGSSRTSGGVFRGQAAGNALNAADFSNSGNNDYIGPVHGQINIYLSQNDPATLSPASLIPYARLPYDYGAKTPIAPVLERVARRYSPVRRE
jgi:hypothetical protein